MSRQTFTAFNLILCRDNVVKCRDKVQLSSQGLLLNLCRDKAPIITTFILTLAFSFNRRMLEFSRHSALPTLVILTAFPAKHKSR